MLQFIIVLHVLVGLAIVGLVLLQQGKGASMGASFGSGGSQTVFGVPGGGNVLTRTTSILAIIFFISSCGLAILARQQGVESGGSLLTGGAVLEETVPQRTVPAPALEQDDLPGADAEESP